MNQRFTVLKTFFKNDYSVFLRHLTQKNNILIIHCRRFILVFDNLKHYLRSMFILLRQIIHIMMKALNDEMFTKINTYTLRDYSKLKHYLYLLNRSLYKYK